MRIRKAGQICQGLWLLGREESCVYLLEGSQTSMLISGGMSYLVPDILTQFETFGTDESRIGKILILHAHFDHVGIVPFFKRRHPDIEIYASARAWKLLHSQKVVETINHLNRTVAENIDKADVFDRYDVDWDVTFDGYTVAEGDRIDLGDKQVHIYQTPGHSSCSISAYQPDSKALFPSDSGGIPYKDSIITSGNSDFTQYQMSLEKLETLDTDLVCADHYGYIAGEEANGFITRTIECAQAHRRWIESMYRQSGNIETAVENIVKILEQENPDYVVPPAILKTVYRQMVRHIADTL